MNWKVQVFEGETSGEILAIIFDIGDIPDSPALCTALRNWKVQRFEDRTSGEILAMKFDICDIPDPPVLCTAVVNWKVQRFGGKSSGEILTIIFDIGDILWLLCPLSLPWWIERFRGSKAEHRVKNLGYQQRWAREMSITSSNNPCIPKKGYRVRYWQSAISPNPLPSAYALMNCKVQGFEGRISGEVLAIGDIPGSPALCLCLDEL